MAKAGYSERDIISKQILPSLKAVGWNLDSQIREELSFTAGRIIVHGKKVSRGERKRADIVLYRKPNIPLAVIEAKDATHSPGSGLQQAMEYARILDLPVAFSSNGTGFVEHDFSGSLLEVERSLPMAKFPSPDELWERYKKYKGISSKSQEHVAEYEYYFDGLERTPRYYQTIAINRVVEAIATGRNRVLLVMATGTGKTYTAFQIIYRLWKSGTAKRVLFLADRNALIRQTKKGDFRHFGDRLTTIKHRQIDRAYEIYLALYQGITGQDEDADAYKQFSRDFFDLVVVDECHRGSAAEDSAWREILDYFSSAVQIGMTATPKETASVSNSDYFGDPIYSYSLRQGIEDGFLAPYRVLRIGFNVDLEGWRPVSGMTDIEGHPIDDRIYNTKDFDRNIVIEDRTIAVARKVSEFLRESGDRFAKTIVFCVDIDHAERMRQALATLNSDLVLENYKYIMRITGDSEEGKRELENFQNPEERYPVIATTSKLMTTGIDVQTCKLIVLDANIGSMTEFKQIIGRGTRINEEYGKSYFTIMDFRNVTELFADPTFDGDPVRIKELYIDDKLSPEDAGRECDNEEVDVDQDNDQPLAEPPLYGNDESTGLTEACEKPIVAGVEVNILNTRVQILGPEGKLITESLRDYTKKSILGEYRSLESFLAHWNKTRKKQVIIDALTAKGIIHEDLLQETKRDLDLFDLICYIAWGRPALTRRERSENVKKRNYFAKYEEKARAVLEALLERYAEGGVEEIEELGALRLEPFSTMGTVPELLHAFGGREHYLEAIEQLEQYIYEAA